MIIISELFYIYLNLELSITSTEICLNEVITSKFRVVFLLLRQQANRLKRFHFEKPLIERYAKILKGERASLSLSCHFKSNHHSIKEFNVDNGWSKCYRSFCIYLGCFHILSMWGDWHFCWFRGDRQLTFVLIRVGFTFCRSSRWGWLVINNQHGEDRQSTFHSPCEFLNHWSSFLGDRVLVWEGEINNRHGKDRQSVFHSPCELLIPDNRSGRGSCFKNFNTGLNHGFIFVLSDLNRTWSYWWLQHWSLYVCSSSPSVRQVTLVFWSKSG